MIEVRAAADKKAEILIFDAIGENWFGEGTTAKSIKKALDDLGDVTDILVRINSPGGNAWDGMAIYNLLKGHDAQVHVQVEGLAASAASLIAMAGDLVTMSAASMMMIHNASAIAWGDGDAMRKTADMLDKVSSQYANAYAARSGISAEEVSRLMAEETWLTPEEAVKQGFADEHTKDEPEPADAVSPEWKTLVAVFKKTPKAFVPGADGKLPMAAMSNRVQQPSVTPTKEPGMETQGSVTQADVTRAANDAAANAINGEMSRQSGIRSAYLPFGDGHRELMDSCLSDPKCSVDDASKKLLAAVGKDVKPVGAGSVNAGADARDKFIVGAEQALMMRAGLAKREAGNELYGRSLCDLAETSLSMVGISVKGMTKDGIARKVLASHSTSDFPLLLANTAGKVLRNAYALAPVTWNRWCKKGSVSDFKAASRHTLGSFSSLLLKPERGEYKQGTIGEERETITALTKGRYISLSREMLVNDDLGGFADMSKKMGRAAARTVEADVYTLLTSASGAGPTMSDTGAFFNATAITTAGGHANLTSSGTAISVASIAVGEAAMMAQKDKSLVDFVVIQPRILLVAPGKKQIAWEVVNSLTDVSSSNANKKNYVQAQMNLEVLASPYLTSTPWYLFSDPNDVEAFEVAFLDGVEEPFIDEEVEFMTDSMNMKVRLDYGIAAIDWRAGYRNAGA